MRRIGAVSGSGPLRLVRIERPGYDLHMIKPSAAVLADALRLDVSDRAEIAAELIGSLDGPVDPGAEAAWADEIERRVAQIESGAVQLEPWDELRHRIEGELLGR